MAITKYGFHSPIVREIAGSGGYRATPKKPRVISYLSQGAAAKPKPKQNPYANLTPGFQPPQVTTPAITGSLAGGSSPSTGPNSVGYFDPQAQPQQQARPTYDPNVNYESDPILQKIRKVAQGQRDTAQSAARTRKVALATQLGDTGFASELGLSADEQAAAAANPTSDLAQLAQTEQKSTTSLEDALNKSNLYFGGHRGTQLGELAQNFLGQRAGALGTARQGYSSILGDLLGAEGSADQQEMDAEAAAYGRAVDEKRAAYARELDAARDADLAAYRAAAEAASGAPPGTPPPLLPPGGGDPVRGPARVAPYDLGYEAAAAEARLLHRPTQPAPLSPLIAAILGIGPKKVGFREGLY